MKNTKGLAGIIAAVVVAVGMVLGTIAAGIILPQQKYVKVSCYGNNGAPVFETRVRKGSTASLPTPERIGCNFAGWYFDESMNSEVTSQTKFTTNTSVYAGWEIEDYSITTLAETAGLKTIGVGAFRNCTALTDVTIPASVTTIGSGAFSGCNLTSLHIEGDIYKSATSANSLGGAINTAQNIYVKESVESETNNSYFLEGNSLFYVNKANNYVQFTKDSTRETKFTVNYYNANGTKIGYETVRYRGTATNAPTTSTTEITDTGIMKSKGWYTSTSGTTQFNFNEITENKNAYQTKVKATLNECTWSEIKQASDLGYASGCFYVGDEKEIELLDDSKTKLTMQIAGFNQDVDEHGDTIGITFLTNEVLPSQYNNQFVEMYNWSSSNLNSYLNSTIYNFLPDDIRYLITAAKKISSAVYSVKGRLYSMADESIDKLFIPSASEVSSSFSALEDDGSLYQLYFGGKKPYKCYSDNKSTYPEWYLRTVGSRSGSSYCYSTNFAVDSHGTIIQADSYTSYAICFGFCI